jgi:hypothetical protein
MKNLLPKQLWSFAALPLKFSIQLRKKKQFYTNPSREYKKKNCATHFEQAYPNLKKKA